MLSNNDKIKRTRSDRNGTHNGYGFDAFNSPMERNIFISVVSLTKHLTVNVTVVSSIQFGEKNYLHFLALVKNTEFKVAFRQ